MWFIVCLEISHIPRFFQNAEGHPGPHLGVLRLAIEGITSYFYLIENSQGHHPPTTIIIYSYA